MAKTDFTSVDEYIAAQPEAVRPVLERVRTTIRKAVPGAEEVISYQVPAYKQHGGFVLYFSGHTKHFSLSCPPPFTVFEAFKDDLAPYEVTKSAIRIPLSQPAPVKLIERIAKFRTKELAEHAKARAGATPEKAKPRGTRLAPQRTTPSTRSAASGAQATAPKGKQAAADAAYRGVTSVDAYIAAQPEASRPALQQVRAAIRKALPRAEESITYNMPTYKEHGEAVLFFAGWKQHFSLYPVSGAVAEAYRDELTPYEVNNKGTARFPLSQPVPVKLIVRIAKFRSKEVARQTGVGNSRRKAG
jgi:uncharacterized protein YdhG (YjbR/CyaY superfamily)